MAPLASLSLGSLPVGAARLWSCCVIVLFLSVAGRHECLHRLLNAIVFFMWLPACTGLKPRLSTCPRQCRGLYLWVFSISMLS